ncbi:MAG: methyltransferase domain-containing protein, partial [Chloroflexota bacterium]|nr:methyltransferase domain-containing protein [Chloroflexota bacterium]
MNHRRRFFDQAADDWDELEVEETYARLREIVAGLGIAPGAAVLDVGCGTGILLPLLRESMNGDGCVVALDLSREMLKRALGKGAALSLSKGQPAVYVQGDAESLPLPEGAFDWVLCNAVFPHFADKLCALAELRRVLRPGGRLVICHTASRQTINEFHRSIGGAVAHDAIPGEAEMLRLLQETGL